MPNQLPLLRTSERSAFTKCRQQWQWGYVDHLKLVEEVPALRFGDLVHQALAAYYIPGRKRGPAPSETFERLYHEQVEELRGLGFNVWDDDGWVDAAELGVTMLERYVEEWRERDIEFEVVASEIQFRFPIRRARGQKPIGIYVGTIDGVWKSLTATKRPLRFMEHKTATAIRLDGLPLDEQAGSYWTYGPAALVNAGIMVQAADFDCITYNFLRKARPNPDKAYDDMGRVLNKDGSISKQQPAPYFARENIFRGQKDRRQLHERVVKQLIEIEGARAGTVPVYKIPGAWYNPNCAGCSFKDMCELHETGNDWTAMRDALYTTWEPYSAHELEHGERV